MNRPGGTKSKEKSNLEESKVRIALAILIRILTATGAKAATEEDQEQKSQLLWPTLGSVIACALREPPDGASGPKRTDRSLDRIDARFLTVLAARLKPIPSKLIFETSSIINEGELAGNAILRP